MLEICDDFAHEFCISFDAQKSKFLIVQSKHRSLWLEEPDPVFQNGNDHMQVVKQWVHLGHTLTYDFSDEDDIALHRNNFVSQLNKLLCHFSALDCLTKNWLFSVLVAVTLAANCGICKAQAWIFITRLGGQASVVSRDTLK